MSAINRVTLVGNLTRDPEFKATTHGTKVLVMSLGVSEWRKDPETGESADYSNYFDCALFGPRAEALARILRKGAKVTVAGRLHQNRWVAQDGTNRSAVSVTVEELELMSRDQGDAVPDAGPVNTGTPDQGFADHDLF
ncbi:MAG: single-stranded DNA-binding protein [Atopobiaceae bacterium]|nr:single-stranded DNA-binding protein [Atopobiaceae bacterium]